MHQVVHRVVTSVATQREEGRIWNRQDDLSLLDCGPAHLDVLNLRCGRGFA
jgi:hypothetical protein